MRRIIFGLIVFIIFTATGVYIANSNLQNDNIILTNNNECDTINIAEEENIYEIESETVIQETEEKIMSEYNIPLDKDEIRSVSRGDYTRYIPIKAIVTAYAPYDNKSGMCNDGTPDTTATNTKPKRGTIAADPKRIPYGTKLYIPEYGYGIVEDTGSALRKDKDNIRIDVYMDTYEEAIEWGKKEMIIYIIE